MIVIKSSSFAIVNRNAYHFSTPASPANTSRWRSVLPASGNQAARLNALLNGV